MTSLTIVAVLTTILSSVVYLAVKRIASRRGNVSASTSSDPDGDRTQTVQSESRLVGSQHRAFACDEGLLTNEHLTGEHPPADQQLENLSNRLITKNNQQDSMRMSNNRQGSSDVEHVQAFASPLRYKTFHRPNEDHHSDMPPDLHSIREELVRERQRRLAAEDWSSFLLTTLDSYVRARDQYEQFRQRREGQRQETCAAAAIPDSRATDCSVVNGAESVPLLKRRFESQMTGTKTSSTSTARKSRGDVTPTRNRWLKLYETEKQDGGKRIHGQDLHDDDTDWEKMVSYNQSLLRGRATTGSSVVTRNCANKRSETDVTGNTRGRETVQKQKERNEQKLSNCETDIVTKRQKVIEKQEQQDMVAEQVLVTEDRQMVADDDEDERQQKQQQIWPVLRKVQKDLSNEQFAQREEPQRKELTAGELQPELLQLTGPLQRHLQRQRKQEDEQERKQTLKPDEQDAKKQQVADLQTAAATAERPIQFLNDDIPVAMPDADRSEKEFPERPREVQLTNEAVKPAESVSSSQPIGCRRSDKSVTWSAVTSSSEPEVCQAEEGSKVDVKTKVDAETQKDCSDLSNASSLTSQSLLQSSLISSSEADLPDNSDEVVFESLAKVGAAKARLERLQESTRSQAVVAGKESAPPTESSSSSSASKTPPYRSGSLTSASLRSPITTEFKDGVF